MTTIPPGFRVFRNVATRPDPTLQRRVVREIRKQLAASERHVWKYDDEPEHVSAEDRFSRLAAAGRNEQPTDRPALLVEGADGRERRVGTQPVTTEKGDRPSWDNIFGQRAHNAATGKLDRS